MIDIDIVTNADGWDALPDAINVIHRAVAAAAAQQNLTGDVTVVLTDDEEIRALNRDWRGFDKPTNVLSFPAAPVPGNDDQPSLGDIVLAIETVQREATEEGKALADHVSHLAVHGLLHLAGHDHDTDEKAQAMEDLERQILAGLGVGDPYGPN
jgi:probable rRNA maturation factor